MGKKILITGGGGFIGSHLAEDLLGAGWQVTVLDNFSSGTRKNLGDIRKEVEVVEGDIRDLDLVRKTVQGMDAVSHHAAQLEIFLGIAAPEKDLEINTAGTLNILRACREHGVAQLINASSACVYGQSNVPMQSEDHPQIPNWEYGVSKLAAERYCQIYADSHGLKIVSLRYGITYGPREWYRRVLTIFLKRVMVGQPPVIFGEGDAIRDFIYVGDAVRLHRLALERDLTGHMVVNAGTGVGTSVKELAELVCKVAQSGLKPIYENVSPGQFSSEVPDKKRNLAELKRMVLSPYRAKATFDWEPTVRLEEGLRKELDWARKNPERWARVFSTQW